MVMVVTVVVSLSAGLAFRRRFRGATALFYLTVASLIVPSILVSLGIGLLFQRARLRAGLVQLGLRRAPHLDAAVRPADHVRGLQPLRPRLRGGGARSRRHARGRPSATSCCRSSLPSLIGVGLFGFTLSYDEFARTLMTAGTFNTLPLEIYGMTTNVTTPVLYALGTVTTAFSLALVLLVIVLVLGMRRRRAAA